MKRTYFLLILAIQFSLLGAQNLTGVKIFINPGHGGFDSDDRNVVIAPYTSGDRNGFWESQSNLDKGLALRSMLQSAGATANISRTTNNTADDLPLSQVVTMANTMQADYMLSIHTNAGNGVASYVLMIHYGSDLTDSQIYNTYNPGNATQFALSNISRNISAEVAKNLYANQITTWSSGIQVRGDKTFARTIMGWSDGYGVLRGLAVPGVISEGAMHDYIPETYRLMNMEYKWLEAWNFYKSFCNYFNAGQIPNGVIAGQVRDSRIKNEATYNKFAGNDQMLPLNGTKLTLVETNETYTVDNFQNGVFVFKNLIPGNYHVKAEKGGYYTKTQEIVVTAHNISYLNLSLNRVRSTPPQVLSYTPNVVLPDSVEASTSITLSFNWDMDTQSTEQAFSISPAASGKFTWEDTNYRMRFTPDKPLEKNTLYTVTLKKSASHPDNLSMENDFSFQFHTKYRNRLQLLASYPHDGSHKVYYSDPQFRLIFDKKLNTTNINTAIKVTDQTNTVVTKATRSVSNNSIGAPFGSHYFNLSTNLQVDKDYTMMVQGDVTDDVGVTVVDPITIHFRVTQLPDITEMPTMQFEQPSFVFDAASSSASIVDPLVGVILSPLFSGAYPSTYSNFLSNSFGNVNDKAVFKLITPLAVTSENIISCMLYGYFSCNKVELEFTTNGTTEYVELCNLNFLNWQLHEVSLKGLLPGVNYQFTGVRITRTMPYSFAASNMFRIDNLFIGNKYISEVDNIKQPVLKIYPNPATSVVQVDVPESSMVTLGLYSLNGTLIEQVNENKMNVSAIKPGMYILKLHTVDNQIASPLIIAR